MLFWVRKHSGPSCEFQCDGPVREEILEKYRDALSRLSFNVRMAVTMHIESGLTYEQIANVLGCRPNAARMMVSRGLTRLLPPA